MPPWNYWDPRIIASLALIAAATLTPGAGRPGLHLGLPDPADLLVNIALFVPFGMAMGRAMRAGHGRPLRASWWAGHGRPLRVAFILSTTIELLQLTVIPGRDTSPWDILANTAGAVLGAGLPATVLALPLIPGWLVSGWLLASVPPDTPAWWGQWAHQFGSQARFTGTIRAVTFNLIEAPGRRLDDSVTAQMKAQYHNPPIQLNVTLTPPGAPSLDRNQVTGIASGDGGEVIGLWQLGHDLELRWHARGTRWGLRHPGVRVPAVFENLPQPEARISASLEPSRAVIETTGRHRYSVRLGPWQGWRLFWPLDPPRPLISCLLSLAWSAGCIAVPLALAMGSARRGRLRDPLQ